MTRMDGGRMEDETSGRDTGALAVIGPKACQLSGSIVFLYNGKGVRKIVANSALRLSR
jgi:hypothetical protein